MKKRNIILYATTIFLGAILSLYILGSSDVLSVKINGEDLDNPLIKSLGGIFGLLVCLIALTIAFIVICVALSGVGLVIFGIALFICLIAVVSPFHSYFQ